MGFSGQIGHMCPIIDENGFPKYNKWLWYRIPLFEYASTTPQLVFTDKDCVQFELDNHFETDGGSRRPSTRDHPHSAHCWILHEN
jgi:hypothetical protein